MLAGSYQRFAVFKELLGHPGFECLDICCRLLEEETEFGVKILDVQIIQAGVQLGLHCRDRLETIVGFVIERPADDPRQVRPDHGVDLLWIRVASLDDQFYDLVGILAGKRELSGGQPVQDRADGENVRAKVQLAAFQQLRRHMGRRSKNGSGHGHLLLLVYDLGDTEIHQLQDPVGRDHDVLGLEIAMDDLERVGVCHGFTDLNGDHDGHFGEEGPLLLDQIL